MTLDAWIAQYLGLYKHGCKPRTLEEYRRLHAAHIAPALGGLDVASVTPEDIQRVLLLAADRSGARTAQAVHTLLRAAYRRAVRSRLVPWSPVDAVDRPQHTPDQGIAMSPEDFGAALPWVLDDLGLSLALLAGLRRGEIAGLQWQDIDLPARLIHIRRTRLRVGGQLVTGTPKSAAGARCVPIAPDLLPILRAEYRLIPDAWVCPCAPECHDRRWQRLQERTLSLSRRYRLHDLRHTYITRLLLAGAVPRVVQYVAGHSSLDMTMQVYAHISPSDARKELDRIYISALSKEHLSLNQGVPGSSP